MESLEESLRVSNDPTRRPSALQTIVLGGAAVAVLDIANAIIFWHLYRGTPPRVILQSVAAGIYGRSSFSGGMATASIGALLHCVIAFSVAATYYLAALRLPVLYRRPLVCGMAYGALVYLVMNRIVIPLSNANQGAFNPAWFAANFGGHLLLVGLPVALIARWSATRSG